MTLHARLAINGATPIEDYHHRYLAFEEYSVMLYIKSPSALAERLHRAMLLTETVRLSNDQTWGPSGHRGPMVVVSCSTHLGPYGLYSEVRLRSVTDHA